jgi:type IV pilus assembly protein PilV
MGTRLIRENRGFSLIEVMVATAVFSLGLGGLSLMMMTAAGGTSGAQHSTVASVSAASMGELILMNPSAIGHYINPPSTVVPFCDGSESCSPVDMALSHLGQWQYRLASELPKGSGLVFRDGTPDDGHAADPGCDGNGGLVVKVFWMDRRHQDDADGGLRRIVTAVPLP